VRSHKPTNPIAARDPNVVRVRRHTDRTWCVVREGENKVPSPKTDLAASLTRIPDVGAGAFALWWLSAYAGIDGAKDCKAKLVNDFAINLYNQRLMIAIRRRPLLSATPSVTAIASEICSRGLKRARTKHVKLKWIACYGRPCAIERCGELERRTSDGESAFPAAVF
jgi:hypothetical protein